MRRVKTISVVAAITLMLGTATTTSISAFDGHRKGFVIGGGLGIVPVAHWSAGSGATKLHENVTTWGEHLLLGYGWNDRNILAVEANITPYYSEVFDASIIQGIACLSWYHYFGKPGRSLFAVGGVGATKMTENIGGRIRIDIHFGEFEVTPDAPDAATGLGYLVGGGYEFIRHLQMAVYLIGGRPGEYGHHYGITHVAIMLSAFAF